MPSDILSALNRSGSGLNLRSLAADLVRAETEPRRALIESRTDALTLSLEAIDRVRGQVDLIAAAGRYLQGASLATTESSGAAASLALRDRASLTETRATLGIQALAQPQVLEFAGFSGPDAVLGDGVLRLEFGAWSEDSAQFSPGSRPAAEITLPAGASLAGLAEALGRIEGIDARLVDKGDGTWALGLVSATGAQSALRLEVSGATGALAGLDTRDTNAAHQVQAAADARLTLDGIALTRPANTIDDLLPGVAVTLAQAGGAPVTLTTGRDRNEALALVEGLVVELNDTRALLAELGARGGAEGTPRGPLAGEPLLRDITRRLEAALQTPLTGFGEAPVRLADLGIETRRDGTLAVNMARFDEAFTRQPDRFEALLGGRLASSRADVAVAGLLPGETPSQTLDFVRDPQSGSASLGGVPLIGTRLDDGRWRYVMAQGPLAGVTLTASAQSTGATITHAQGLAGRLAEVAAGMTGSGGPLDRQITSLDRRVQAEAEALAALERRAERALERYSERFAAMELAVTRLNATGDYLTSLTESWNRKG